MTTDAADPPAARPPAASAGADLLSLRYRATFLGSMLMVSIFHYADRSVFAVLAQPIKRDLQLSDFQLGVLQGFAFALLYATLGVPVGRFAERRSRVKIVALATAVWSFMTVASGLAGNFFQLLAARFGVGVGEAGFQPPTLSMVGDLFPRDKRASAMAIIMLGTPLGTLCGALVGGFLGQEWGWRVGFAAMGLPGLAVALLVVLVLKEPSRGLVDKLPPSREPPPSFTACLRAIASKPSLMFVIAAGATAGIGMSSISQFLALFLARVHELSTREAATAYGFISAGYLGLGFLVGSFGTDHLVRRGDLRWSTWGSAFGLCVAPLLYWLAFNADGMAAAAALLIVAGTLQMSFAGPTQGLIQNLLEPRMRATGAAVFFVIYALFGVGVGPALVGLLSDMFAAASFPGGAFLEQCPGGVAAAGASAQLARQCEDAAAAGVSRALQTSVFIFFVSGVFFLLASRTIRRDAFDPHATTA